MPTSIADTLSSYWDAGNIAAPRVFPQNLSMVKGGALAGNVGAVDHDENIASYALITASASGAVSLNAATGAWTYTPAATFAGSDSFVIKVSDAAGNVAEQSVSVFVRDPAVNYAPDAPTITAQPLLNVQEGAVGGLVVATLAATDPNLTTPTLRIASDPGNLFEIVGNQLRFRAGANVAYATLQTASVQIEAVDAVTASGLVSATQLSVNVGVLETNHAPVLAAQSFSVAESTPGAGQIVVATLAPNDADLSSVNRNFRYQVLSGDTSVFSVDEMTGQVRLQGALDYETRQLYTLQVKVWDGGALGSGLSSTANINFNITNVNEGPSIALVSNTTGAGGLVGRVGGVDPEGSVVTYYAQSATAYYTAATRSWEDLVPPQWIYWNWGSESQAISVTGLINAASGNVYYVNKNLQPVDPDRNYIDPASIYYLVSVRAQDPTAIQSQPITLRIRSGSVLVAPIVLDLDGDGLELVSLSASTIDFDMAGNGEAERTGWVGADDGLLVYDRNGNGLIDSGVEIAFSEDVDFAVSDLEGLRAYDSNEDGLFNVGDAEYSNFAVWRDANQDGISQTQELSTLAQLGIEAINLTLNPTGLSVAGATDNVVYGESVYMRADGGIGTVGDVYLAYIDWTMSVEAANDGGGGPGLLPPIVLDLDGNGVQLSSSANSGVRFDANGDGFRQATGWFSAGDGVLALDRNGDGLINSGLEISFREDVNGAQSDLEGLTAYDSNENGMIDAGDAAYGDFIVWRDANQDGFSQAHELASLARHGIASINLTRSNVVQASADASVNTILADGVFTWRDGGVGQLADVSLGYQSDGAPTPDASEGGPRTADDQGSEHPNGGRGGGGGGGGDSGGVRDEERSDAEPIDLDDRRRRRRDGERARPSRERGEDRPRPAIANLIAANDSGQEFAQAAAQGAPNSALHTGLGVMERKLLGMIDAMAQFEASSSADLGLGRRKLDPRVAELLTALPDIR